MLKCEAEFQKEKTLTIKMWKKENDLLVIQKLGNLASRDIRKS